MWYKQVILRSLIATVAFALPVLAADKKVHSVTGDGLTDFQGLVFRINTVVHQSSGGQLSGHVNVILDLAAFGLGTTKFNGRPTCLEVDGNRAWIGMIVEETTDESVVPTGLDTITFIEDLNGKGEDLMFAEGNFGSVTCHDKPKLPTFDPAPAPVLQNGNYNVR